MFSSAVLAVAKLVGFLLVSTCAIVSFYAATHAIDINTQLTLFFAGLLALAIGIFAGPLYCLIGYVGLSQYLAFSPLGAVLLLIPVLAAWCVLAYNVVAGFLKG